MRFSKNTKLILKNFVSINSGLWFRNEGYLITVMKQQYNLVAIAKIEDEILEEFGIFDLARFLGVLSLFDDEAYDLSLVNRVLILTEGERQQLKYVTCEKRVLDLGPRNHPEVKAIKMPDNILAQFTLPAGALKKTLSIANVMSTFDKIGIKGENGQIILSTLNSKDPTSDLFAYKAGETSSNFNIVFPLELFQKLMDNDIYEVKVSERIAQFTGTHVTYYLTPDANQE